MTRKHIKKDDQSLVLTESRRRCALCFGLEFDFSIKKGQIAHLDRNHENNNFSNLAFLCLLHHDEYDSRTSQSKGLTAQEVLYFRDKLFEHIQEQETNSFKNNLINNNDKKDSTFKFRNPYSYLYKWIHFLKDEGYSFYEILSAFEKNPATRLDKNDSESIKLATLIIKHALGEIPDSEIMPYCPPTKIEDFSPIDDIEEGFLFKALTPDDEEDFYFLIDKNISDEIKTIKDVENFLKSSKESYCKKILYKVHSSHPWETSHSKYRIAKAKLTWRDFKKHDNNI